MPALMHMGLSRFEENAAAFFIVCNRPNEQPSTFCTYVGYGAGAVRAQSLALTRVLA